MRYEKLLSRLLMVVTLAVALFSLAPTGAQAHVGHRHALQLDASVVPQAEEVQVVTFAPITVRDVAAIGELSGRFASLPSSGGSKAPHSCPGGSCHSVGSGCCPVWLQPTAELLAPALRRLALVVTVIGGAGITPGALPEPPNFLV